ncbi:hypothetical protein V5O48_000855 [Marasmius crinis-equi]|uniref:FHA domain-containing protein n=1 Tax=Marasmius crinis-equi TaxID=585013 RepID=A0ABR3G0J5_9AGAR
MPRQSQSPPRRYEGRSSRNYDRDDYRDGRSGNRRERDYDSRKSGAGESSYPSRNYDSKTSRGSSYRRENDLYGYREEDRERERRRDRERYDGARDRDGGRDRRSASPRRRRSSSRSRSKSPENKAKPNFAPSGLLAAETNTVKSVDGKNSTVLKYNEPPEARKPVLGWRLYVFKGSEQNYFTSPDKRYNVGSIFSRERAVLLTNYPDRLIQEKDEFGSSKGAIKPFIIDLDSTNGTHVNDEAIPKSRYYELKAGDVIKFGQSNREYVFLHDDAS